MDSLWAVAINRHTASRELPVAEASARMVLGSRYRADLRSQTQSVDGPMGQRRQLSWQSGASADNVTAES